MSKGDMPQILNFKGVGCGCKPWLALFVHGGSIVDRMKAGKIDGGELPNNEVTLEFGTPHHISFGVLKLHISFVCLILGWIHIAQNFPRLATFCSLQSRASSYKNLDTAGEFSGCLTPIK